MSFSESYDECMGTKGLPLLGEIFSRKTLSELMEIFEEIDQALEASGGKEVTFAALSAAGTAGLSAGAAETVGMIAAVAADLTVFAYLTAASNCVGLAAIKAALVAELDASPGGAFKDQVESQVQDNQTATA